MGSFCRKWARIFAAGLCSLVSPILASAADAAAAPISHDDSVRISLFANAPDIVTPIGATVDARGRLLVVESASHFRPKNYAGPAADRIRILEDASGSGRADRITTFFAGVNFMMNLVTDPRDGSILVSSRNEIFRLEDRDGVAGRKTTLATLQTTANYPHNGLAGLAMDREGNVYFGIGENLGTPWTLVGADGKTIRNTHCDGEIFRVDRDGRGLTKLAHGFWNPFGLGFDPLGTLWAVDNDPDGRPPCRLIPVAPGGDYGFEFRYGRSGLHPLQAWDAELPGTLRMIAGVGEAPCAARWHRGRLLVTSWRDHQIESYALTPRGGSFAAAMQPLVTGDADFRPVALAEGKDGSLYVTDWVSQSYELHGKGRIWKLTFTQPAPAEPALRPTEGLRRTDRLRHSGDVQELIAAMGDEDAAIAQAAQFGLSQSAEAEKIELSSLPSPEQRIGLLAALLWRGTPMQRYVGPALADPDARVRQMGVRVVAEQDMAAGRPELEKLLASPLMTPKLMGMAVAAIAQLDGDPVKGFSSAKVDALLLSRLSAADTSDATRAIALRMLHGDTPNLTVARVEELMKSSAPALQLEAVRYLQECTGGERLAVLARVAADPSADITVRAEAVVALADGAEANAELLFKLLESPEHSLRHEALRSLRPLTAKLTQAQRAILQNAARGHPEDADPVERLVGVPPKPRAEEDDVAAWDKLVAERPGDAEAGRRVFFHPNGPACYRCHTVDGRGGSIGPDLTMIGRSRTRTHVLESILQPSKEIAPLYSAWRIKTNDGQTFDGMLRSRTGKVEVFVDASRAEFTAHTDDITDRKLLKESIMPSGLVQGMTDQELRDVIAMLMQKR